MSIDNAAPRDWDRILSNSLREASFWDEVDAVNKPQHYNNGSIEAIEYIKQQLGDRFSGYLEGNLLKYVHRWKYKNGIEDLRKAEWYLTKLIEEIEHEGC